MNSCRGIASMLTVLILGVLLFVPAAYAAKPIAKITGSKGEVFVQSDTKIRTVSRTGLELTHGDYVQTRQGHVHVTFNDGSVMKIRPFSSVMIQEREEKSGFWLFQTKKAVRRLTVFVGKLWFKSGVSKRKNYLQTPTSVCGLRGSDGDAGFDNKTAYLKMYGGEADVVGNVKRGPFGDPGFTAASNDRVYRSMASVHRRTLAARATGRRVDFARARVHAAQTTKAAAREMERNPDDTVKKEAKVTGVAADAKIAAAKTKVVVEEVKEAKERAERVRSNVTSVRDEAAAQIAEKALRETQEATLHAEEAAKKADLALMKVARPWKPSTWKRFGKWRWRP